MQLCDAETKSDAKSDQIMVKLLKRGKGNSMILRVLRFTLVRKAGATS